MTEDEDGLDLEKCRRCINSDGGAGCVAKQEAPFDTFKCEHNEQFEEDEQ